MKLAGIRLVISSAAALLASASPVERRQHTHIIPEFTTGSLCSQNDPNFIKMVYGIAKCARDVGISEKEEIGERYGISRSEWHLYEFDHLIPLGIGGSNSINNVWPQPGPPGQGESGLKDAVELSAYIALTKGATQREAVQMICDWLNKYYGTSYKPGQFGL